MKPQTGSTGTLLPKKSEPNTIQQIDKERSILLNRWRIDSRKLIISLLFLAAFLASLLNTLALTGQEKITPAAGMLKQFKALSIGDTVPDIILHNIHNYPKSSLKLSELRGKLLILDFWATWCAPCVAMIPKMDSLQEAFGGKIQFLSVTYQSNKEVLPFLEKLNSRGAAKSNLPLVMGDTVLQYYFPHRMLPHYVWIGADGVVKAITGMEEISAASISRMLALQNATLPVKKDAPIDYDPGKLLLANSNKNIMQQLRYQSVLTGYVEGLPSSTEITPLDSLKGRRIVLRNLPLPWFYEMAYKDKGNFGANRMLIQVRDLSKFKTALGGNAAIEWLKQGNGFCYELVVPPALDQKAFSFIRQDMQRLFPQYQSEVVSRKTRVLSLRRTSFVDKLKTAGGRQAIQVDANKCRLSNAYLRSFTNQLALVYLQNKPPLVDDTGYRGKVDLDIQAPLNDVAALNAELKKYDLEIVERETGLEMLLISDSSIN